MDIRTQLGAVNTFLERSDEVMVYAASAGRHTGRG